MMVQIERSQGRGSGLISCSLAKLIKAMGKARMMPERPRCGRAVYLCRMSSEPGTDLAAADDDATILCSAFESTGARGGAGSRGLL
jgi:hypothetical protein